MRHFTMEEITKELNINRSTLYRYFKKYRSELGKMRIKENGIFFYTSEFVDMYKKLIDREKSEKSKKSNDTKKNFEKPFF